MQPSLMSGKYIAILRNGYNWSVIPNNEGQFQFNSTDEADNHRKYLLTSFRKYALEHNYPMSKVNNLRFEIKQIS